MSQFALPLDWPADERDDAFILSACNAAAVRHLGHVGLWPVRATILTGPRKSGRSLLARIFTARMKGLLADDAERMAEETLFHLWNRAQETRRPLLIVADDPPPAWPVGLPDLASRLAATPVIRLDDPDDGLVVPLMEALLARRGLALPRDVAAWVAPRIERTHVAILRAVEAIDAETLSRRHRVTLPLARAALEEAGLVERARAAG